MADAILTLNAGSSSIKFALFEAGRPVGRLLHGQIEQIGEAPHLRAVDHAGETIAERHFEDGGKLSHEDLLKPLLDLIDAHRDGDTIAAAGHRVVHGGTDFAAPAAIDDDVLAALDALSPLAPLHQKHNLAPIRALRRLRPALPQVACFDTAFHRGAPHVATRLPLPARYEARGVRRYGFHGLSYEYVARTLRGLDTPPVGRRVIAAHLGNGASACAMLDGRSVDTSMGFTALDGLMMGTRTGSLDPGVVLYMLDEEGLDAGAITTLLYSGAGLLGVSGISSDMRDLLASDRAAAREAVDLFVYRAAREMAALTIGLGGLDTLVFTAGIGEHAAPVRAAICRHLAHFGIVLDPAANDRHAPVISAPASAVTVRVVGTDEEAMIATHTLEVLGAAAATPQTPGKSHIRRGAG